MKHLSIGLIFATLFAIVFISCREGEKGTPGPAGSSGTQLPYKSGSITGTLTGTTYQTEEDFTQNLNFQYFKSPSDNAHTIYHGNGTQDLYTITRYDSTGESYINFTFDLNTYLDQNQNEVIYIDDVNVTIVSQKKTGTGSDVFYFGTVNSEGYSPFDVSSVYLSTQTSGSSSNITIDNVSVNATTGLLSFDYSLEIGSYVNSTGNSASMDGTVSVTPYNVSYRQAAE